MYPDTHEGASVIKYTVHCSQYRHHGRDFFCQDLGLSPPELVQSNSFHMIPQILVKKHMCIYHSGWQRSVHLSLWVARKCVSIIKHAPNGQRLLNLTM